MTITILLASALAIAALDQATKAIIGRRFPEDRRLAIAPGLGLRRLTNVRGGLFHLPRWAMLLLWSGSVALIGLILVVGSPARVAATTGLGLVLGGATSNLADRLIHGGILDFIAIGRWPVFNVADAAMVAGTVLVVWSLL